MMLRLSAMAVIGLTLSSWSTPAVAQDLPTPPEGHVLDLAEVLDATAEARLERVLAESEEKTGVDMDVVTLTDTASNGGGSEGLEAYAERLFATWNAEASDASKGILIVVSTDPADARIALGTDYAPVYNDRAARVLGTSVLPAFREGRIPAGIEAGVLSARDQLIVPFLAGAPITASEGFPVPVPDLPSTLPFVLIAVGLIGTIGFLALRKAQAQKTCPSCEEQTLTRTFEVIEAPVGSSQGSGIEHRLCKNCGFTDRGVYDLNKGIFGMTRRTRSK
jgi:uncharacterized membrane protein YgcG